MEITFLLKVRSLLFTCFTESTLIIYGDKICDQNHIAKHTELLLDTTNKQFIQQIYSKPGYESRERLFFIINFHMVVS